MTEDEIRDRIVATADELYYARSIQAVGMDDLRQAAEVSLKRLYSLFPSKESIVLAVLVRRHERWTTGLEAAVDEEKVPEGRVLAVFDYLLDWFDTDSFRGCGFINAFGELGAVSPGVANAARVHKRLFQEYVARLVSDAGGGPELAAQLAILAEGAQTTAAISGENTAAGQARRAAETLIAADLRAMAHSA
ncbi:TetR/AcrR family transcriptional regulator [Frondihabitans sp. VKM Ac-2883]|uniref:TetR/AcrR family transcriptional regulator n=1 Tax=Frondihabitans sp. VKM Ac-2883 TaxID=2783823 RepID=UPI00188BE561|nr:TetR family transcriptional regulator [Frondihabitans sp. VKM Ac-2883]MBF4575352.1 TetR/AcrR family transcriptional regulator [Frondihabitans sp. VKM Ac-2883]